MIQIFSFYSGTDAAHCVHFVRRSCQDMPDGLMRLEDPHDDRKGSPGYVLSCIDICPLFLSAITAFLMVVM